MQPSLPLWQEIGPSARLPQDQLVFSMPSSDAVSQALSAQEEEKITEKLVASLL